MGQAPLPSEGGNKINAPGVRAEHFARSLAEAGHKVHLLAIHNQPDEVRSSREIAPNLLLQPVTETAITTDNLLPRLEAELNPAALIGASVWPSYLAALFGSPELPLWGDLFGSPLAEGQAKAALYQDDSLIEPFARFEAVLLNRADVFSSVSRYQEYALVGALATHGRLNRSTYGYHFVYSIPAALDAEVLPHDDQVLRGSVVPEDAFVVLWSGGYNTWTDIDTLFAGLEQAMHSNPRLHFVSTGGALPPHDSMTYPRFQSLVATSAYQDRFHLLGWLPYEGLQNYYYESDLGIILDKWSYEGVLGSRTRLLDWLKYGLPAVVTPTAELTEELSVAGLAFPFAHGDSAALAEVILELVANPSQLEEARTKAREYTLEHYHYSKVCAPLVAWAANPHRAPDVGQPRPLTSASTDPTIEKQLAIYRAQIEEKNQQITTLEKWAQEMETALKQTRNGLHPVLNKFLSNLKKLISR